MAKIGDLIVRVGADITEFVSGMDTADRKTSQFRQGLNKGVASFAKYAAAATAAGAAISIAITRSAAEAGTEIANLARVSRASTTEFQRNAVAARTVGIEQEKLADIYKDMRDRVGDFIQTGGGPLADFFERIAPKIGVTAEQFRKLSGPQALQLFVDSLERANLSQNEMVFQMEAIASDSTMLLPLLKNNGAAIKELGDEAERAGRILSEIDVARLQLAGQQMQRFDQTVSTLKNQLGAEFAPILAGIVDQLDKAAIKAGGYGNLVSNSFATAIDAASFLADAVGGVGRTFELVGKAWAVGGLAIESQIWRIAHAILNGPIDLTNRFIDVLNEIPGVDIEKLGFSEIGKEVRRNLDTANAAVMEGVADIHDTLMEPLPGTAMRNWVAEVRASADEAAKAMADALNGSNEDGPGLTLQTDEDDAKKRQEAMEKRLEMVQNENQRRIDLFRERYFGEEELRKQHEERMLELDEAYREQGIVSDSEYQQARLDNMREYLGKQYGVQSSGYDALGNIAAKHWNAEAGMAVNALGSIVNAMASNSEKMFRVQKTLGIANATISALTGSAKALELGWPLGPIAAATILANGFAKVNAIRSQSMSGGGGGGSVGGSAGSSIDQQLNERTSEAVRGRGESSRNVYVRGINPNEMFSGRQMIDIINEAQEEGAQLRVIA